MNSRINYYQRNLLKISLLVISCLPLSRAASDNSLESRWLYSLKHAHLDNGSSLPISDGENNETLSLNSENMKRLFSSNHEKFTSHYSRLQFSPLNYQADINEKQVQVKLFYQF